MKKENILIIVLVGAILITTFVWFRYFQNQSKPAIIATMQNEEENKAIFPAGKEFIALLKTLETIKLDADFLNDPIYKKLRDLTPEIILPETKGRNNPFAPYQ
ncbi:MAG: hypothetical protein A3H02_01200 [Candidatus Niyogibacteria bacterium RIFCSPLOWO2_12_FULL_41_13]|uniref:Uncharacterized protein n=1 Tax=Candidatus Niyogibacteria bacterium RIFCSPLOWO2_12_FULL_41_13 TaxID=1801726 RepID=A0A1G2F3P3_9BACT|nr:MAG: hypothetical protein A3H02_01200 [Candidatus Niyogibacteria bacterium RIFCSPLOWO2_12_FULL_41_13]